MKKKRIVFAFFLFAMFICTGFLTACGNSTNLKEMTKRVNTYKMNLEYNNETHEIVGSETLNYKNLTGTILEFVCFHLYPRAFTSGAINKPVGALNINKAYPNGMSYGNITINKVLVNNANATYTEEGEDKNILKVNLENKLDPENSVSITIDFVVTLPNVNHRFGYGENTINLANFYPIVAVFENGEFICDPYNSNGDPFYSDMSNYDVTLTYNKSLVLANTGKVVNSTTNGELTTTQMKANVVRDFAMVLSSNFKVLSGKVGKTQIYYYSYGDETPEKGLQAGVDAISTFNDLFGTYPYETFSVVESNFVHGGMEFPNLVYISDDIDRYEDYLNTIIHETAHQWWYQLVGSNAFRNAWQDEGLTEYSCVLFYEQHPEYGINPSDIIKNSTNSYVTFIDLYSSIIGDVDTSMNRHLDEYDTEPEYVYMTYVKGMLFFDSLRELVGDKAFFKGLKEYVKTYEYKNINPSHLIACFEKVTKCNLESFFKSWTEGKVLISSIA